MTRATVVSLATAALGMAFAVLFFSFVLGDVYSPLQVRVYAAGLGALGLASYVLWVLNTRKSALREAAELQGILTVALTSEPDSGWWEKG